MIARYEGVYILILPQGTASYPCQFWSPQCVLSTYSRFTSARSYIKNIYGEDEVSSDIGDTKKLSQKEDIPLKHLT